MMRNMINEELLENVAGGTGIYDEDSTLGSPRKKGTGSTGIYDADSMLGSPTEKGSWLEQFRIFLNNF